MLATLKLDKFSKIPTEPTDPKSKSTVLTHRRPSPEQWIASELMITWGDTIFDIGIQSNSARVFWVDGPTINAFSCSFRRISHALRLEMRRSASLPAMAWFLHQNRVIGDGLVSTARQHFIDRIIYSTESPDYWQHLRRIGEVAAARHPMGRPTWGEVSIVERLLHGATDDIIDSALLLAKESDFAMVDLVQAAYHL